MLPCAYTVSFLSLRHVVQIHSVVKHSKVRSSQLMTLYHTGVLWSCLYVAVIGYCL